MYLFFHEFIAKIFICMKFIFQLYEGAFNISS